MKVLIAIIVGFLAGLISGIYANSASIDEGGREEGIGKATIWAFAAINGVILGMTAGCLFYPATYVVILLLLIGLQAINAEGRKREQSWDTLNYAYSVALILSIVNQWDKKGPNFKDLWLLLLPVAVYVTGLIKARLINEYNRGSAKAKKVKEAKPKPEEPAESDEEPDDEEELEDPEPEEKLEDIKLAELEGAESESGSEESKPESKEEPSAEETAEEAPEESENGILWMTEDNSEGEEDDDDEDEDAAKPSQIYWPMVAMAGLVFMAAIFALCTTL